MVRTSMRATLAAAVVIAVGVVVYRTEFTAPDVDSAPTRTPVLPDDAGTVTGVVPSTAPSGGEGRPLLEVLSEIPVEVEHRDGYDRDLFDYPIVLDDRGCDTRDVVLIRDSTSPAQIDSYGCHVVAGDWYSPYDNLTWTDPGELQIDHVVALAEAWDSGAWAWTPGQRRAFANHTDDPRLLRAVTGAVNQAKSADDPADWMPAHSGFVCQYLADWTSIKAAWSLTMDTAEHDHIRNVVIEECPGIVVEVLS